jgi:MazG family protein
MDELEKLLKIMAALRDPQVGCPWDREQTFKTIAPYTVEEAYEVADAIDRDDLPALRDELGDLLFQVVFHARMAEEASAFDFEDVAAAINDKMLRRHPHVFGSDEERKQGAVEGSWERIKASERAASSAAGPHSALDGVASALPALKRAQKLGKRASMTGFDWPDTSGVYAKIEEETAELRDASAMDNQAAVAAELGDLLFAVVNLARHLKVDAEQSLVGANQRFEQRFRRLEAGALAEGLALQDMDIEALEARWQTAKTELGERS